jgi:hypothetical protein
MTDPRPTMKHAMFDAFSEMNSLSKCDLSTGAGQRGARVALRRIEMSLDQLVEQTREMRAFIKNAETAIE